jgi:hypothetical protein
MTSEKAWVVSANMGYGHMRATYPLRKLAVNQSVYLFGEDCLESPHEGRLWHTFQYIYEFISRTRHVPILGPMLFSLMEKMLNISPFYPHRDLSAPSFQVKSLYWFLRQGMGAGLIHHLTSRELPIVTSFYSAAIAAEERSHLPVYCIICDADLNRVWVSENVTNSRIIYFVPCGHAMRRLKQYGVPDERIYLTGFPLPDENIGGLDMPVLRSDLWKRLIRLDPTMRFRTIHGQEVKFYLGRDDYPTANEEPITVTYCVGGAGAQTEIVADVLKSLKPKICAGKIHLNLVAGVRSSVAEYFNHLIEEEGLNGCEHINIIFKPDKNDYFQEFSSILHDTDLLWTKPSELSFYCGLGIPIIMAPPIGPHEIYNRQWLREIGAGIPQGDPQYCSEWIFDYLIDGRLSQAAWDGFLYARKMGTYKIEEILTTGTMKREISPLKR